MSFYSINVPMIWNCGATDAELIVWNICLEKTELMFYVMHPINIESS